jgi:hypothetical protein
MTDILKTTKYTLLEPVKLATEGREITELTFRRIKGKDLKKMDRLDSDMDKAAFAITELSGQPPELFDEMDAADIEAVGKIIEGFIKRKAK